jgi:hypothetical protein
MTIFAIGLTGIYGLLSGVLWSASYSRHEIVVANLLREQNELFHNIRDTNVKNYAKWDTFLGENAGSTRFASGVYIVENNFSWPTVIEAKYDSNGSLELSPVFVRNITNEFFAKETPEGKFETATLYLDRYGRYTHTKTDTPTPYASYTLLTPLLVDGKEVKRKNETAGYILDMRVIVKNGTTYREYDMKSLLTNWLE